MRAAVLSPSDTGGTMQIRDLPDPEPGEGEVLVRIHATALNRGELLQRRRGRMSATPPAASPRPGGVEFAGEVARLGAGVGGVAVGDRVMGRTPGSYAEYVVVDPRELMPVPSQFGWDEAAAIPNVFVTAHDAIVTNGRLQPGESVLINAASSGVGTAAIQIAALLGAKPVIGSSGSNEKLERLRPLGMDTGINYREADVVARVMEATGGAGVNLVVDSVGGSVLGENLRCMALQGRLVSVGRNGGETGELDMDLLALRRLQLIGVTFRTRTREEAIACSRRFAEDLLPAFGDGRLRPVVDRVFPLAEIAAAQDYMLSDAHLGKIIIRV